MNRGPSTPGHGFTPRPGRPAGAAELEEPTADDDDVRSARSYASVRSGASCVSSLSRPASTAARSAGGAPQASPARGAAASDASLASSTNGSPFRLVSPSSGTLLEGVHKAAFLGDSELLARCLHEQPECVARASPDGWLPLHYAAEHGHTECAEQLLGGRSNVDARGRDGWTPLMWAARRGHEAMVDVLLDAGADPSLAHVKGWCAAAGPFARPAHRAAPTPPTSCAHLTPRPPPSAAPLLLLLPAGRRSTSRPRAGTPRSAGASSPPAPTCSPSPRSARRRSTCPSRSAASQPRGCCCSCSLRLTARTRPTLWSGAT